MSGIIGWLAGAPQQASTAGGYYQTAANELATEYGSPAAQMFSKEYMGALQPQIQQLNQQGLANEAATGQYGSGAGRASLGDLTAQEAGSLAQGVAPMYQQALSQYGNIIGAMPGAQENAYQGAIQDFYQALQSGASAYGASMGVPTGSGTGYVDSGDGTYPASLYDTSLPAVPSIDPSAYSGITIPGLSGPSYTGGGSPYGATDYYSGGSTGG